MQQHQEPNTGYFAYRANALHTDLANLSADILSIYLSIDTATPPRGDYVQRNGYDLRECTVT